MYNEVTTDFRDRPLAKGCYSQRNEPAPYMYTPGLFQTDHVTCIRRSRHNDECVQSSELPPQALSGSDNNVQAYKLLSYCCKERHGDSGIRILAVHAVPPSCFNVVKLAVT